MNIDVCVGSFNYSIPLSILLILHLSIDLVRAENEKINKNIASYRHAIIPNKNYTSNEVRLQTYKRSFLFFVRCSLSFSSDELVHYTLKNASNSSVEWSIQMN